jgi:hypothetical protein
VELGSTDSATLHWLKGACLLHVAVDSIRGRRTDQIARLVL